MFATGSSLISLTVFSSSISVISSSPPVLLYMPRRHETYLFHSKRRLTSEKHVSHFSNGPLLRRFSSSSLYELMISSETFPSFIKASRVLQELHEYPEAVLPHRAVSDHVGGEISLRCLDLLVPEEIRVIVFQLFEHRIDVLPVGICNESFELVPELVDLGPQFADLRPAILYRFHDLSPAIISQLLFNEG